MRRFMVSLRGGFAQASLAVALAVVLNGCLCGNGLNVDKDSGGGPGDSATGSDASDVLGSDSDVLGSDGGTAGTDSGMPGCLDSEVCGDKIDNDCDGVIDEDCVCPVEGETRTCYTGPLATLGVGICTEGTQICGSNTGKFSYWGPCEGAVPPGTEDCNGLDDDCDGAVDDELGDLSCGTGACAMTIAACTGGAWQTCTAGSPTSEVCNGLDDDCDGSTDEDLGDLACGVGACATTVPACTGGVPGICAPGAGGTEVCNGLDDDCDGLTDESLGFLACGSGACATMVAACVAGVPQTCTPGAGTMEICNGADDDCDGSVDEGFGTVTCGVGACYTIVMSCAGGTTPTCTPGTPSPETCNGIDDDCDGMTDEGLGTLTCGTGACADSTPACIGGVPQTCTPGSPTTEVCNGADDDCDGAIDESLGTLSCGTGACYVTVPACTSGTPGVCTPGMSSPEICDSIDNDCDGMTDEGGVCVASPPTVVCPADVTSTPLATVALSGTATDSDGTIVGVSWTVTSAPTGSSSTPMPPTSSSTSFFLDLAGTYELTFCATDDDGQTSCCTVTIFSVPDELLRFELFWDDGAATSTSDLDLHVIHPSATAWSGAWDCYFGNCIGGGGLGWPPMGPAGNPSLDLDDVDGFGPENTNIPTPEAITYRVGVHYWYDASDDPASAVVRVWCGGIMVYETPPQTMDQDGWNATTNDFWKVADVTWVPPASCTVSVIDTIVTRAASLTAR